MGCTSSKQVEVTAIDVYRPAPSSFAVFDINAVQEPWQQQQQQQQQEEDDDEVDDEELKKKTNNPTRVTAPIFEKLNTFELVSDAPQSWEEISKALENLKPNLQATATPPKSEETVHSPAHDSSASPLPIKRTPRKSFSFHTLDELDAKTIFKKPTTELKKSESMKNITEFKKPELKRTELKKGQSTVGVVETKTETETETEGVRRLRENVFILKDKLEREREGKEAKFEKLMMSRRDPLSGYPEKCPPNAADSVVLYTTSLGGVRRTYEDCNRARSILEGHRVVFDERDVSLHGGFLNELKELLGEGASVPRLFVKGRYVGGVEEVVELNELGKLGRILSWARVERGVGRQVCEGCGGARFVPCLECGGSCKVYVGGGGGGGGVGGGDKTKKKERCPKCNENGLVHCPFCIMI